MKLLIHDDLKSRAGRDSTQEMSFNDCTDFNCEVIASEHTFSFTCLVCGFLQKIQFCDETESCILRAGVL